VTVRRPWGIALALAILAVAGRAGAAPAERGGAGAAGPRADWRTEFEEVCGKTQDAMALPLDGLRSLVERCDRLLPEVEKLADPERRVFLRRLRACRDLYAYVLASRQANR
jgi:hypothetical protein